MRVSGSRPVGPVVITDNRWQAEAFRSMGLFAFAWEPFESRLMAGLMVVLYTHDYGDYCNRAAHIAEGQPKQLDVIVKGRTEDADLRLKWTA